jgi:hypothetical protein
VSPAGLEGSAANCVIRVKMAKSKGISKKGAAAKETKDKKPSFQPEGNLYI